MVNASFAQYDFRGGEWSPFAQGRMDDPRYKTGMKTCLNAYPIEEGAWNRRSGTRQAATTRSGVPGRLNPFEFSEERPYNMEFTNGHLRLFSGVTLVYDDLQTVTSISTATPAILTVPVVTWATDDQVYFIGQDEETKATVETLFNRAFHLTMLTTSTFEMRDAITGLPIDGSTIGWVGGLVLSAAHIEDILTPYANDEWRTMRVVQADTSALMLSGSIKPYLLTALTPPDATSFATFSLAAQDFIDGPYLDPVPGSTITPAQTKGLIDLSVSFQTYSATQTYSKDEYVIATGIGYKSLVSANINHTPSSSPTWWTPVSPGAAVNTNGFVATDIGRCIRLYNNTNAPAWSGAATYDKGDVVSVSNVNYKSLATANLNKAPATEPLFWEVAAPGWTWGRVVAMSTTGLISPSGIPNVGTFTGGGGLAAAFDGTLSKTGANSASVFTYTAPLYNNGYNFIGKNYTGSPKAVSSVIVTPSNNYGFAAPYINSFVVGVTLYLRGSNSTPSYGSGTLLATASVSPSQTTPVTMTSSDATTTWNYIWIDTNTAIGGYDPSLNIGATTYISQIQFFGTGGVAGTGVQIQLLGPQLPNTTTMTVWRLGAYSDTTGWPKNGCYHEGRLWLAGAIKNRFDASRSNSPYDFTPTNAAGVVGDSNAITGVFNSSDINSIFWLMPDLQGIVAGTQKGEWLIQASAQNLPLTPASTQAHRVTKYGCANIEPKRTGLTTMFVQKFGRRLHEYLSDIFSGRFFAPNATERAKHLTNSGIKELAYQEELTPIVWARMGDGTFAGSTYRRVSMSSSSEPVFNGWHHHTLGSGRLIESMVVGPSVSGDLDSLAMITNDPETGIRHVEVMETMFDEENVLTDAWFLDDAITPSSATTTTLNGAPALRFAGLWHLNDRTVTAWIGGLDCGDFIVNNGAIIVPYTANSLLSINYLTDLSTSGEDFGTRAVKVDAGMLTIPAVVGFSFTSRGQILRVNDPEKAGTRQGPAFGKHRRSHKYAMLFHNAQGVSVGTDFDNMKPVIFRNKAGTPVASNVLYSGMLKDTLTDSDTLDGNLAWEISRPYPASVAAAGQFLSTQDE